MNKCLQCEKEFNPSTTIAKFCSQSCSGKYNQNCKKVKSWESVDHTKEKKYSIKHCQICNSEIKLGKFCKECMAKKTKEKETIRAKSRIQIKMLAAKNIKQSLVDSLGGCKHCGYKKCLRALSFHHIDPATKKFTLDQSNIMKKRIEDVYKEVDKCVLLCQNCHSKLHQQERDKKILLGLNAQDRHKIKQRNFKFTIIQKFDSKCCNCNMEFNFENLQCASLHHKFDKTTQLNAENLLKLSEQELEIEIQKCQLLCSNCHMEHHDNINLGSPSTI